VLVRRLHRFAQIRGYPYGITTTEAFHPSGIKISRAFHRAGWTPIVGFTLHFDRQSNIFS